MRLTFKLVQEQASKSGYQIEKSTSGYVVNGQKFRLLVEVADYLNRCLEVPVAPDLTIKEVQQLATEMGFLVQVTEDGYGIFFEGQLLGVAKLLSQVVEALPQYKEAIARYRAEELAEFANLPNVGDTHVAGNFVLRCAELKTDEYAAVWDVWCGQSLLGEICMGWDGFWSHALSFSDFTTPQEAISSLSESAQELIIAA